jgi:hypothetical protein
MNDEPKVALDTELLAVMRDRVLTGHPEEAQLRTLLDNDHIMALAENPDDPDEILVFMVDPGRTDTLLIGAFPAADAIPRN